MTAARKLTPAYYDIPLREHPDPEEPELMPATMSRTELERFLDDARQFHTSLATLCASGGLGAHRSIARPITLAALDRALEDVVQLANALLHDEAWVGLHGRHPDRRYGSGSPCYKKSGT
jgi:hypothetical protein